MKSKYAVIMTSLTLAIMLVSTPAAFAQIATPDGHSILFNPASQQIPPGGTITAIIGVQAPVAADIVGTAVYVTQDRFPYGVGTTINNLVCESFAVNGAPGLVANEDTQSLLVDDGQLPALVPVAVEFNGGSGVIQEAHVQVGPIGNANPVVFATPGGNVIPYYLDTSFNPPLKTPLVGNPVWVQIFGPNAADGINPVPAGGFGVSNDVLLTQAGVNACGCTDFSGDGNCAGPQGSPPEADGVSAESYNIILLVGGALMEISNVSLLVAGAQSNALWLLPILGLAGTIIAIRKLEA